MVRLELHARLRSRHTLELFTRVFRASAPDARGTEAERLLLVPLVFGLLPATALTRADPNKRIKPAIREHLRSLSVEATDALVDTIKEIADQYYASVLRPQAERPRKLGIESVRALRSGAYSDLRQRQRGRCAVCGVVFGQDTGETLDHIIPWSLAGDRFDGSNWQLLCGSCNLGKREWLSVLQSPQAQGWHYGVGDSVPAEEPTLEARYIALALAGACQAPGCLAGPRDQRLGVVRRHPSGLAVIDNLAVLCSEHIGAGAVVSDAGPSVAPPAASVGPSTPPPVAPSRDAPPSQTGASFAGYILVTRVAGGGMAEAFLAVDEETGEDVFLKRCFEESGDGRALRREAEIYSKLDLRYAQHVPRVVEAGRCDEYFYLVTERAETDLARYVKDRGGVLPTPDAKAVLRAIIDGLRELHRFEIVHRDLKPSNVLRVGDRWLLADFGISKDHRAAAGGGTFQLRGTTGYAAPEQILTGVEARPAADVFALGKLMIFLLTGSTDIDQLIFREWRKVARLCTHEDADERPTLEEISEAIEGIEE